MVDVGLVLLAVVTSLAMTHSIIGVREGTLVAALGVGLLVSFINTRLISHIPSTAYLDGENHPSYYLLHIPNEKMFHPLDNLSGYEVISPADLPPPGSFWKCSTLISVSTHPIRSTRSSLTALPLKRFRFIYRVLKPRPILRLPGERSGRTADTVVIFDGKVLGKPVDEADACRMITLMQGREQKVVTGVTVRTPDLLPEHFLPSQSWTSHLWQPMR